MFFRFVARFARFRIEDSSGNKFASTAYFAKPGFVGGECSGGNNRGGTSRGEFSGGEFASHLFLFAISMRYFYALFLLLFLFAIFMRYSYSLFMRYFLSIRSSYTQTGKIYFRISGVLIRAPLLNPSI